METRMRRILAIILIFGIALGFSFIWHLQTDGVSDKNISPAYAAAATATPTPPPATVATSLTIEYSGEKQLVGTLLNPSLFKVSATMGDGTVLQDIEDFTFSPDRILRLGENKITFTYKNKSEEILLNGVIVTRIEAELLRNEFSIGNAPDAADLIVTAIYSDDSSEEISSGYTISPEVFNNIGDQKLTVAYRGRYVSLPVTVSSFKPISSLSVEYTGGDIYNNIPIDKSDVLVTATYTDGTAERITTFSMLSDVFSKTGANTLKVAYRGQTAETPVVVTQLSVKSVRAKYDGDPVNVGWKFDEDKLHVYATCNNGKEYEITDYTVSTLTVNSIGENIIKVFVGGVEGRCIIMGVEKSDEDFVGECSYEITSDKYTLYIETSANIPLNEGDVLVELVKRAKVRKAFAKLKAKEAVCIGFDYGFNDVELENLLPVTIRVTMPDELPADFADLYFTPDLKSIVAKMNREVIDSHTVDFTIFNTGTYMLVHDPEAYKEEPVEDEEDPNEPTGSAVPKKKPGTTPTPKPSN